VLGEGVGALLVVAVDVLAGGAVETPVEVLALETAVVDGAFALPPFPPPHAVIPIATKAPASNANSSFISPAAPFLY
jgi:hypothetical protein